MNGFEKSELCNRSEAASVGETLRDLVLRKHGHVTMSLSPRLFLYGVAGRLPRGEERLFGRMGGLVGGPE